MAGLSILEAIKIQSRVLIPVVKELEKELGVERAHAIVGRAIAENYAAHRASQASERDTHPGVGGGGAPEFPIESEVVEHTDTSYGFDITGCAFADYFRRIGEPEIGALMTCGVDFAVEARLRPGRRLPRLPARGLASTSNKLPNRACRPGDATASGTQPASTSASASNAA